MELQEVEQAIKELENRVDRLRALYEQYFLGFEKLEPTVARKDVERRMQVLLRTQFRNTALRFRFTMLQQRYNTYQSYWMRICRQIEDGTYKRHLQRMKAKEQARRLESGELALEIDVHELDLDEDVDGDTLPPTPMPAPPPSGPAGEARADTFDVRPTIPRMEAVRLPIAAPREESRPAAPERPKLARIAPVAARPAPVAPAAAPPVRAGLSENRIRELYAELLQAKRAKKESTADMRYDSLAKSLRESAARLSASHGAVDFVVAEQDGRTVLKPKLG